MSSPVHVVPSLQTQYRLTCLAFVLRKNPANPAKMAQVIDQAEEFLRLTDVRWKIFSRPQSQPLPYEEGVYEITRNNHKDEARSFFEQFLTEKPEFRKVLGDAWKIGDQLPSNYCSFVQPHYEVWNNERKLKNKTKSP